MDVLLEYCEGCGKHINQDIVGYNRKEDSRGSLRRNNKTS